MVVARAISGRPAALKVVAGTKAGPGKWNGRGGTKGDGGGLEWLKRRQWGGCGPGAKGDGDGGCQATAEAVMASGVVEVAVMASGAVEVAV